jgi:N-acetylglutamate synthase-like GNAT family acetyltransferase
MSPKWYKSFGFKEFDKELLEKEVFEGCEEARL